MLNEAGKEALARLEMEIAYYEKGTPKPALTLTDLRGLRSALLATPTVLPELDDTRSEAAYWEFDARRKGAAAPGSSDKTEGVFGKYIIRKADGKALDQDACYFVLRLDTDTAAQKAAMEYARTCENRALAADIIACVTELSAPCSCRSAGDHCPRHPTLFSRVWKAGVA